MKTENYGKTSLGKSSGITPTPNAGWSLWIENGEWFTAPIVSPEIFGKHAYANGGYEDGIRDCPCGCYMCSASSGGPCDPFGHCPKNPIERHTPPKYKSLIELAAAFKSGELDKHYYLMLDKGGAENSLNYFNPDLSDAENEKKQEECRELFQWDEIEDVFKAMGIPCQWC